MVMIQNQETPDAPHQPPPVLARQNTKAPDGVVKPANLALSRVLMQDSELSTMDQATTNRL
jgi:hypothetical protein